MSDQQPRNIASAVTSIAASLPGQFLALVLLNVAFVLGLLWFLDREQAQRVATERASIESREHMMLPFIAACVPHPPNSASK